MNILLTTHSFPWPPSSGTSIRAAHTIRSLAKLGRLDVVTIVNPDQLEGRRVPASEPVDRAALWGRPRRVVDSGGGGRARWLCTTTRPLRLARDYSDLRDALAGWARPHYDLVWFGGAEGFAAFVDLVDAPVICSLDDLEDQKLSSRRALGADDRAVETRRSAAARVWAEARDRVDAARWARLHLKIGARSAAVAVCSEEEAGHLAEAGIANAAVLPNVYPEPVTPAGRERVGETPTILFAGVLTYEPNIDAARFLVTDVLPHLRARIPSVQVRLVGAYDARVAPLAGAAGVTLAGRVPDMQPELARADVVAVPIRFGGGTRVKILEAFAHRLPVVATTPGAAGLDVVDGEHLLLADDPEALADACARAFDPEVRGRVCAAGHDLWYHCHRPAAMERGIAGLVEAAVG